MRSFLRLFLLLVLVSVFNGLSARVNTIHISTQNPSCNGSTDGFVTIDSLTTTAPSGNYTISINTTPATTFFSVGDTVFKGQQIAKAQGYISAPVHASSSLILTCLIPIYRHLLPTLWPQSTSSIPIPDLATAVASRLLQPVPLHWLMLAST